MVSDNLINIIIKIQDEASKVSEKVETQMQKLGNTSQNAMQIWARAAEQAAKAMDTVQNAMDKARDKLQLLKNKGSDAFNKIKNGVNSAVTSFNNLISKSNTATLMMEKIKSVGDRVKTALTSIKLPSSLQSSISTVTQKFETLKGYASSTAETIKTHFSNTASAISQKFETISTSIKTHFESIKTHVTVVGSSIATSMGSAFTKISSKVVTVASNIKTKLSSALDSVKSKVNQLAQSFQGMGGMVSSLFGALGMAGIGQLTVGLAMTREQMTNLMSATMGSTQAAQQFVSVLDNMTNNSLVSLNDLGTAMNTIKMSTGMTNEQMQKFATTVNDIGQRAILMGKDSTEAMTIMQAAGRGLNGEFDILQTNFGITKDKLTDLGWSGAAEDVEGYMAAIDKYLEQSGSMDEMMNTTTGLIKTVEKKFTSAGRQIGEVFIPHIQNLLKWMGKLGETSPEVYKILILIAGAVSLFATAAPTLSPILTTFSTLTSILGVSAGALLGIAGVLVVVGLAVYEVGKQFGWWSNATEMIGAVADGVRRLWEAFSNSPQVQIILNDLKTAFYAILTVIGLLVSPLGLVLNRDDNGTIDIVSSIIGFFNTWGELLIRIGEIFAGAIILWKTGSAILYTYRTITGIFDALQGKMTTLTGAAQKVVNAFNNLKAKIESIKNGFNILKNSISSVKEKLVDLKNKLSTWTTSGIETVKTKFNELKEKIINAKDKLVDLKNRLSSWVTSGIETVKVKFSELKDKIMLAKTKLVELWATMKASAAEKISGIADKFRTLASSISLAGIKAKLYAVYQGLVNAATAVWNALLAMNPVMLVVIAIVALVAILVYLYNTNETVRNAINALWQGMQQLGQYIYSGLIAAWETLVSVMQGVASFLDGTIGNVIRGIISLLSGDTQGAVQYFTDAWNTLMDALGPVGDFIQGVFSPIIQGLMNLLSGNGEVNPVEGITQGFMTLMMVVSPFGTLLMGVLVPAWQLLFSVISQLFGLFMQLAGIFVQLITGQISLQQAVSMAWQAIRTTISSILSTVISRVVSWAQSMWSNAVNTGRNFLNGVVQFIGQLPSKVGNYITSTASRILSGAAQWVSNARSKASAVVSGVISYVSQLPSKVYQEFMNIGSRILSAGSDLVNKAKQIGKNIVDGLLGAMGIHSPGTIQESVVAEFVNMITRVKDQSGDARKAVEDVAQSMIDAYKNQKLDDELVAPEMVNSNGGFMGDPLVGNALDEYATPQMSQEMDITPTMNMDENNQLMENYTLMGQTVTDMFSLMNTDSTLALNSLTAANTLAYNTMSATEQQSMNLMNNHIRNTMSQILLNTRTGMNNSLNVTRTSLNNMQSSTTKTTQAMTQAWNTMKNSIISAANQIKTDATSHFNQLSSTIGTFYRKLQNPSQWGGSGDGTRASTRKVGHTSNPSFFKKIKDEYPSYMSYYQIKQTPLYDSNIGDYVLKGDNNKVDVNALLEGRGYLGSWESTASPNVQHIKNVSREWDMKGPAVNAVGKSIDTGLAFKVKDFEGGTPNISFESFQNIAGAIFSSSGVPYEYYYNSDRYGSWQNALTNGSGCNCWDGAHALLALASIFGFGGTIVHGNWGSDGHVWAVVNGVTMDTTAHQKGYGWTKPGVNSGPVGHKARRVSPNNLLEDFDVVKELNKSNNDSKTVENNDTNQIVLMLSGETTLKHEFINLPENIDENEIVRLINEAPEDQNWLKTLVNNMDFQELDRKIKQKIQFRENRAQGV